MIEILPNWHPIFVHFSIALLVVAGLFFFGSLLVSQYASRLQLRLFARWNLWLGAGFTVLTVAAGVYAYYTVAHDGPSHEWMTIHRNVAFGTFVVFACLAIWSFICAKSQREEGKGFMFVLTLALVALLTTSWLGGELVYRHGLGVMSLPKATGEGHDHDHGDGGHSHSADPAPTTSHDDLMGEDSMSSDEQPHDHKHETNEPHSH